MRAGSLCSQRSRRPLLSERSVRTTVQQAVSIDVDRREVGQALYVTCGDHLLTCSNLLGRSESGTTARQISCRPCDGRHLSTPTDGCCCVHRGIVPVSFIALLCRLFCSTPVSSQRKSAKHQKPTSNHALQDRYSKHIDPYWHSRVVGFHPTRNLTLDCRPLRVYQVAAILI